MSFLSKRLAQYDKVVCFCNKIVLGLACFYCFRRHSGGAFVVNSDRAPGLVSNAATGVGDFTANSVLSPLLVTQHHLSWIEYNAAILMLIPNSLPIQLKLSVEDLFFFALCTLLH